MPFVFSAPLREKLLWPFPEFFEKCPLIKEQLALPFISLNVLEFQSQHRIVEQAVSIGTVEMTSSSQSWREVCSPKPRGLWEWRTRAKYPSRCQSKTKKLFTKWCNLRKQRDPWKVWLQNVYSPLCLLSPGGCSLFFRWRSCRNQLPNMPHTSMPSNYSL